MGLNGSTSSAIDHTVSRPSINLLPTVTLPFLILKLPAELIGQICMYLAPNIHLKVQRIVIGLGPYERGLVLAIGAREYAMQQVEVVNGQKEITIKKHKSCMKWLDCIERWRIDRAERKAKDEAARAEEADSEEEEE
ncbi:hypothetical protein TI39_contig4202g00057 [Zymoseptoria brevis]|uniref:Uncharacterized protein n=1 Tax=Zymoseptoria brevis TaxID=1047168 RepID=A0A0F4GAB6_9PEZI|nr:hypothetical protein TI39_contig4202g00057 [Zymoseptoria brevis]